MKKGMTLIELIVSMAIFLTISTLIVGAFVTATRMRTLTGDMRESQQKARVAYETITRLSRQANKVVVSGDSHELELYFNTQNGITAAKFAFQKRIDGTGTVLYYDGCAVPVDPSAISCSNWTGSPTDMLGGSFYLTNLTFTKTAGPLYPTLRVFLDGVLPKLGGFANISDNLVIDTTVLLEGIR